VLLRVRRRAVEAGRGAGGRRTFAASRTGDDRAAIREWARENGYAVSDRGRISAAIVEAYNSR